MADLDHVPTDRMEAMLQSIREDPHTLLSYRTISGNGIRVIFLTDGISDNSKGNLKLYARVFEETNLYYSRLLDCECDLKCKTLPACVDLPMTLTRSSIPKLFLSGCIPNHCTPQNISERMPS